MHVFLTGDRMAGKSQLVQTVCQRLGLPRRGFITRFAQNERCGSILYLLPADNPSLEDDHHIAAIRENGKMRGLTERFDTLGTALLANARASSAGLIVMDECGHLEKDALVFQREIAACLNGSIPVLGVLRKDQPWHAFIRCHPSVTVLTVTEENRDQLPGQIIELLQRRPSLWVK